MNELVSVIITAFNRKQYLESALNSVLNQQFDKFEIILVTNFDIEELNYRNAVRKVYDNQEYLGEKVYKGLKESVGDIICFLDDDDMFAKGKLRRVFTLFREYDLVYYHNNIITVDEKGREVKIEGDYLKVPPYASFNLPDFPLTVVKTSNVNVRSLLKLNANFNSSSICVRRDVLESNAGYLRRIKAVIDSFFFYSSLLGRGNILLDPERLTYYRIHSLQTSSGNVKTVKEYKESMSNLFKKAMEDFHVIMEMLSGKVNKATEKIVKEELERYKLLYKIFSSDNSISTSKPNMRLINYYLLSLLPSFLKDIYIKGQYNRRKGVKIYETNNYLINNEQIREE